jgi:hypothetical protein
MTILHLLLKKGCGQGLDVSGAQMLRYHHDTTWSQRAIPAHAFATPACRKSALLAQAIRKTNGRREVPARDLLFAPYRENCESGSSAAGLRGEANTPIPRDQWTLR